MPAKYITVAVTRKDIRLGKKEDCYRCPIARALTRHLGQRCSVGYVTLRIVETDQAIQTTRKARRFVLRFDDGAPVEPGKFRFKLL